ncbi:FGGY-family carbohydrate kinase [sulfur-oxidizing endosymbiont of Gigantopelta aegis]|uniref:FGGY-family carbohydrate kinase n=1 Tax=sulfur-oxidizing endosymbiont of Gigantopelta aegis TaxID=2794934 RepID=UPI0018DDCED5|nr:FGGY-family carbohydrate kinase [sulfur-oxidizing endosymbiont of Gigantopelta aegis]
MYSLGIDLGTSGIRAVVMNDQQQVLAESHSALPASQAYLSPSDSQTIGYSQKPSDWWHSFEQVIYQLATTLKKSQHISLSDITHLAIDGTSGTVLLCDINGQPLTDALMYNDQRAGAEAQIIKAIASDNTGAIGATSGLAKVLWLVAHCAEKSQVHYAISQSDWLSGQLMNQFGFSDHNNVLKMGYDAQNHCWPDWLVQLFKEKALPDTLLAKVFIPGEVLDTITPAMAKHFGFNHNLRICAGTTDSTAAIIASGAKQLGDAVTSLGSSMVMKVLADKAIYDQASGVYSQPYGDLWLVGGASNAGGEVLKQFFSIVQMQQLTLQLEQQIQANSFKFLDLNYYPLASPGERFPVQDPQLKARLSPRPKSELQFFQALLEGLADIEALAYSKLLDLGAPYPKLVKSMGGGAVNTAWRDIRQQKLGIPVSLATQQQAAAGVAILAQSTWH